MDLEALMELAADYDATRMPGAAADLRRRLKRYRSKVKKSGKEVGEEMRWLGSLRGGSIMGEAH